ncbi:MAG: CoA ester lyase [Acidimicrobiales bacterium]
MTITKLRSLLFMPAVRPEMVAKGPRSGADGMVIDCEDATPANAKAEGRRLALELAPGLSGEPILVFVRVNAVPTEWFADDIAHGLDASLDGVVVPVVETTAQLDEAAAALAAAGLSHLGIIAGIETALGVADCRELLAHRAVVGGYFGAEDFIADMGGIRTESNVEVAYARGRVALAGRLAGVPVLDQIVANFKDDDRLHRENAEARAMGYAGKLCIHPQQVAIANADFMPSAAEVDRATRLLAAYDDATAAGIAAIAFEGQMVDEPLAAQARQIIASAR